MDAERVLKQIVDQVRDKLRVALKDLCDQYPTTPADRRSAEEEEQVQQVKTQISSDSLTRNFF
jgi:hypothetical protein